MAKGAADDDGDEAYLLFGPMMRGGRWGRGFPSGHAFLANQRCPWWGSGPAPGPLVSRGLAAIIGLSEIWNTSSLKRGASCLPNSCSAAAREFKDPQGMDGMGQGHGDSTGPNGSRAAHACLHVRNGQLVRAGGLAWFVTGRVNVEPTAWRGGVGLETRTDTRLAAWRSGW